MELKTSLPTLICVMKQDFEPSRPLIEGVISASKKEIKTCTMTDIGLTSDKVGIKGSPTYVSKAFRNISTHNAQKFKMNVDDSVNLLSEKLLSLGVQND